MQSDLRKVMSAISSMRKKNNSPRVRAYETFSVK
jgi:hypothetical protein